jgi:hypothetical protein
MTDIQRENEQNFAAFQSMVPKLKALRRLPVSPAIVPTRRSPSTIRLGFAARGAA